MTSAGSLRSRANGFTLIEVMVAMAVVAVALPALLFALIQQVDGTGYLRERTLASWVAANKLSELQLIVANSGTIPSGDLEGESRFADRDWHWGIEQQTTELPGFIRIEIAIGLLDDQEQQYLHRTVAFLTPEKP